MSIDVASESTNDTVLLSEDVLKSLMSPAQIAFITIGTSFVFYLTIMLIICIGEYCHYVNGKHKRNVLQSVSGNTSPGNIESEVTSNTMKSSEKSVDDQSDYTSQFQTRQLANWREKSATDRDNFARNDHVQQPHTEHNSVNTTGISLERYPSNNNCNVEFLHTEDVCSQSVYTDGCNTDNRRNKSSVPLILECDDDIV